MDVPRGTKLRLVAIVSGNDRMHLRLGKQHATMRKTKHRGLARVATDFLLNLIAYNLIRIPTLLAAWLGVSSQQHPSESRG